MAYTKDSFGEYIYSQMRLNMLAHFENAYGSSWKHNWIDKEPNPDWDGDEDTLAAANSNRVEQIGWNSFSFPDEASVRTYIYGKYVDVIILSIVLENIRVSNSTLIRRVYTVRMDVGPLSPEYWRSSNVRIFYENWVTEARVREKYSQANHFDILNMWATDDGTGRYNDWTVIVRVLPGHEDLFIHKWYIRYPNRWHTDVSLPDIPQSEFDRYWIKIENDHVLEEHLAEIVPNTDMNKTLESLAYVMAEQLFGMLEISNYDLMPIYIENSNSVDYLRAYPNSKHDDDPRVLPTVHPNIPDLRKGTKELNIYWNEWDTPWHKHSIVTPQDGIGWRGMTPKSIQRRAFLHQILDSSTMWKGIFTVDNDEYDFYDPSVRPTIYRQVTSPHKLEWAIHSFNERFNTAIEEEDPGNTHTVVRYPLDTLEKGKIVDIVSQNLKILPLMSPSKFKNTDTLLEKDPIALGNYEFGTSLLSTTYKDDIFSGLRDVKACFIDEFVHFPAEIRENHKQELTLRTTSPPNFDIPVGENVSYFDTYDIVSRELQTKTLKFDKIINIISDDNRALAIGDTIYHICEIDGDEVTVVDEYNDINNSVIGNDIEVITYWATSVPGTLTDNAWNGKKIEFTKTNNIAFWDGVMDTLSHYGYEGVDLIGPRTKWLRDVLYITQMTLHDILNKFVFDSNVLIENVDIVSEFDDDRGIATEADLEIPAIAARILEEPIVEPKPPTVVEVIEEGIVVETIDGGYPYTPDYAYDRIIDDGWPDSIADDYVDGGDEI